VMVVLDLGAEDTAQSDQQFWFVRHRCHALQQQQSVGLRQGTGQGRGIAFGGLDEMLGAATGAEMQPAAELGTGKGFEQFETVAHDASPLSAVRQFQPISAAISTRPTMQPIFETPRLLLRPRTLADTDACLSMDRDPAVTRFVHGPWSDPIAHRAFVEARTVGPYAPGLGYWTIRREGEFLGWVLLIPADGIRPEIEIGWRLLQAAWRQGFATEAATPLLRHAFGTLQLPAVIAEIDPDNNGSRGVAEKLGLRRTGMVSHEGKPALRYSMTLDEYGALNDPDRSCVRL
jgi:RimJ/RimL family protein N-acetyltransferase